MSERSNQRSSEEEAAFQRARGIGPRRRQGEQIIRAPKGMMPTRYEGEIVLVPSRKKDESLVGNSPYTQAQIESLKKIQRERIMRRQQAIIRTTRAW